jgi:regulation of enolase protein 1 (concanavalin A-like superfamily)
MWAKKTILIALFLCLAGSMASYAYTITVTVHEDDFEDREIGSTTEGWLWFDNASSHVGTYVDFEGSIVREHAGTLRTDINQRFGYKTDIEMTGNTSDDPCDYTLELDIRNLQGNWNPHIIEIWILTYNPDTGGGTYGFGLPVLELLQEDEWVHVTANLGDLVELGRTWWEGTEWDMTNPTWSYEIGGPPWPGVEVSEEWTQVFLVDNLKITLVTEPPEFAREAVPEDQSIDVPIDVVLSWTPGIYADKRNVYFGTSADDVNEASVDNPLGVLVGPDSQETTYDPPGLLDCNQTYYWRVDEVNDAHPDKLWKGKVWNFTTGNFLVVDDFEDYNDVSNRIYDTWGDYYVNNTGMTVGHLDPPFAERTIVHRGRQAMYMRYDNDGTVNEGTDYEQSGTLLYSETEREWADPQDWTAEGVNSLAIWFRGIPASVGSFTEGPPMVMTAGGADIWDEADEFHFAYKRLSGAGSITARVVSLTNTNTWAKAGVMIRQTLEPGSTHAMMVVTPGQGVSFQYRIATGGGSEETTQSDITAPQWVRLTRTGNTFTGEYSDNGTTWTTLGSVDMPMLLDTYIGLCLTSHNVDATCTAEFSDVTTDGTGDWKSQDIGIESNTAEQLYVVLQDSAGNSAVVTNPDPAATTVSVYTQWSIPLTDFANVNLQAVTKMSIGVGDRANTQPGSAGDLYIDDIGLSIPSPSD